LFITILSILCFIAKCDDFSDLRDLYGKTIKKSTTDGTYYGKNADSGNACGHLNFVGSVTPVAEGLTTVAIGAPFFRGSKGCGMCFKVSSHDTNPRNGGSPIGEKFGQDFIVFGNN